MTKEQEFRKQTEEAKLEAFSLMCKKVAELEQENAELKEQIRLMQDAECSSCTTLGGLQIKINDLEKENAELKKRNGELAGQKASLERWFGEAKSIIREYVDYPTSNDELWKLREKAEAFLEA